MLLILVLAGCRTVVEPRTPRSPATSAAPPSAYYDAGGDVPAVGPEEVVFRGAEHEILRVELPPRVPPELSHLSHAEDPIEILIVRPRRLGAERRPLILMSPILANSLTLMNEFATGFTRQGFVAAIVMRKEFEFDPATALDHAEGEFRTYVMQSRQAVDYLVTRPEVDPERLATFGVSAGATISACLAGVDDRFRAHVLVLAGGPVADVLSDTGIRPNAVCLEVPEEVLAHDPAASGGVLAALKRLGVQLAIDDFGTASSSLPHIRDLAIDRIKIDRSFVAGLGPDPEDSAIVAAIVSITHSLGMEAVAEGVETVEQVAELKALGCDVAQGFLFSRPVTDREVARYLDHVFAV